MNTEDTQVMSSQQIAAAVEYANDRKFYLKMTLIIATAIVLVAGMLVGLSHVIAGDNNKKDKQFREECLNRNGSYLVDSGGKSICIVIGQR